MGASAPDGGALRGGRAGLRRNARIAGGAPDFLHLRRACEGIYDRMFTAAAAYYQNFHIRLFYPFFQRNFKIIIFKSKTL